MSHFIVTPFIKKDNKFALFTVNASFGIKENKTFNSVEEAKDFPLVQQMFYLPFVKSVELMDNGLALERFDILDWKDVIDEVGHGSTKIEVRIPSACFVLQLLIYMAYPVKG